jgi:hypothetical protein
MTTTIIAAPPTTAAPINCAICGRPLHAPTSRVLRAGETCRARLTEHQLIDLVGGTP